MKRVALILTATLLTVPSTGRAGHPVFLKPFALRSRGGRRRSANLLTGPLFERRRLRGPVHKKVGFSGRHLATRHRIAGCHQHQQPLQCPRDCNFFSYNENFTSNGLLHRQPESELGGIAVDYYPFHNGFHVSPGVLLRNGNQVTANANVPAGSSFTLTALPTTRRTRMPPPAHPHRRKRCVGTEHH